MYLQSNTTYNNSLEKKSGMRVLELLCASIFDFFPLYLFLASSVQSTPSIPAAAVAVFSSVHEGFESTASVRQAGQEFFPVVSH